MIINKIIDDQMAAWARNDLIGMLADAGHALVQTGLKVNGARYQDVLHGQGYPCEANTCRECLIKWLGSPEKEAAPEPVTSGDRIRAMTDEELAERERLERLYEETRQIADRRAWDETSRTMAYNCGQEAKDGQ